MPRVQAFAKRWEEIPPLSIMVAKVAVALGVELGKRPAKENNLQELADAMGAVGMSSELPSWLTT